MGSMKFVKTYYSNPINTPSEEALMIPAYETTCVAVSSWRKYVAIGQIRQGDKKAYVVIANVNKCGLKNKVSMEIDVSASLQEPSLEGSTVSATP